MLSFVFCGFLCRKVQYKHTACVDDKRHFASDITTFSNGYEFSKDLVKYEIKSNPNFLLYGVYFSI